MNVLVFLMGLCALAATAIIVFVVVCCVWSVFTGHNPLDDCVSGCQALQAFRGAGG
jgi:hypothetical protein